MQFSISPAYVSYPTTTRRRHAWRSERNQSERWKNRAPRPLPALRERSLTLPLIPGTRQRTWDQSQSGFFMKLPLEVRRLICHDVLGGEILHIATMHNRLGRIRCWAKEVQASLGYKCRGTGWSDGSHLGPRPGDPQDEGLLSLVMTCRRVYACHHVLEVET